jgi:hypothetical protein
VEKSGVSGVGMDKAESVSYNIFERRVCFEIKQDVGGDENQTSVAVAAIILVDQ